MYIAACKTVLSCLAQSRDHTLAHLFMYTRAYNHVICVSCPFWVSFPRRFNDLNVKQILLWLHLILKWMADLELKERHTMGFSFWIPYVCLYRFRRSFFYSHTELVLISVVYPMNFPTRIRNENWSPWYSFSNKAS